MHKIILNEVIYGDTTERHTVHSPPRWWIKFHNEIRFLHPMVYNNDFARIAINSELMKYNGKWVTLDMDYNEMPPDTDFSGKFLNALLFETEEDAMRFRLSI
jgi:hypothetical protein